jgi:S-adenosylmethionine:tRNA ribosyltransferase-isomerase
MVLRRDDGTVDHRRFRDLPELLKPGDLLVANDSRVIPARLLGRKRPAGGHVEALLLHPVEPRVWEALVRGRVRPGTEIVFANPEEPGQRTWDEGLVARVQEVRPDGVRLLAFAQDPLPRLSRLGHVPLPPYIHAPLDDPERYQTVYARVAGSSAAPTAGLHFTPGLLRRLEETGIQVAFVTLHIGLDTFQPISEDIVEDHAMHREWYGVPPATVAACAAARARGGRVIAVGTTAVRALESAAADGGLEPRAGWTELYITPGYRFRAVDALITNFHLPRSTLLVLVSTFAGEANVRRAYDMAVGQGYRFYSFGDAMLIA